MQSLKQWLKVVLAAAFVGTLMRFVFFILLAPAELRRIADSTPYPEIARAFLLGFRFDLSAICYLTLLFWLVSLVIPKSWSLTIWKALLTTWSFLLIVDIGYYSFYNDRINVLVFGFFEDDTWALVKTFWKNYPVVGILFATFVFGYFFHKVIQKTFPVLPEYGNRISFLNTRIVVFVLLFIGARGTFALFPLGDHDTVISTRPFLNTLSYSSAHALSRAIKLKQELMKTGANAWNANLREFGYLGKEDQAFEDFFQKKLTPNQSRYDFIKFETKLNPKLSIKPHVILLVMESWGYYGLQFQKPEFDLIGGMKKHFEADLLNIQMQSATGATTGSLSCLLAGIPQRPISAFMTENEYLKTGLSTSPAATYKAQGYQTHFVYGGNPGWRDMNKFALTQGFDVVEGEIDVEKKLVGAGLETAGRHDWGVYDEDVFKFIELTLKDATKPQMMVVMTTTNHPPYELPKTAIDHKLDLDKFPEKNLLIDLKLAASRFSTFRYSSDALSDFLDRLKSNPDLNSKSIIAATADHTFWIKNFTNTETFMRAAVPFYVHLPTEIKNQMSVEQLSNFKQSLASHQDIWPTLYELSLPKTTYQTFGRSLFENPDSSYAFNAGREVFTKKRGVFVNAQSQFSSLEATVPYNYAPTEKVLPEDTALAQKYRALMGSLDSYLHHSKINP